MVESVTVTEACLLKRLHEFTLGMQPGDLLFEGGAKEFRRVFDDIVEKLQLPESLLFKPYSIRRGAATMDFRAHGDISRTCVRGRWANERSCRIYVNDATTELSDIRLSARARALIDKYEAKSELWFGGTAR